MTLPSKVRIVEVGPRDGLQNEAMPVSTKVKVELIRRLGAAGLKTIEATSFVSPKWVPQMADSAQVFAAIEKLPDVTYPVLTPNMKGFEAALAAGAKEVAIFGAASEAFSRKNINCSIAESLERFGPIVEAARAADIRCAATFPACSAAPTKARWHRWRSPMWPRSLEMGCHEISLGDTIGTGTPEKTRAMIEAVARRVPLKKIAGHYHDTYGMAAANIYASLQMGIGIFDSSVAGLGGCPYAAGASGNVATEDVVWLLTGLGIDAGIDLDALVDTGVWISAQIKREPASRVARAILARRAMNAAGSA
ncbi:MAG: hydroxymethylglutaryl-CoA lyase [Sulfuritalea sp.]|nr:hydroxymethylglutaryl-CoA lyase [Sulfuritalea sp.]